MCRAYIKKMRSCRTEVSLDQLILHAKHNEFITVYASMRYISYISAREIYRERLIARLNLMKLLQ